MDWIFTHPPVQDSARYYSTGSLSPMETVTLPTPHTYARVVAAMVGALRGGGFPPPSDHLPVLAVLEILSPTPSNPLAPPSHFHNQPIVLHHLHQYN